MSAYRAGHVVVGGRPNVGKSTLFNRLLGRHLSIVTPKRNTTRYCIRGVLTEEDRQLALLDTPGWETAAPTPLARQLRRAAASSLPGGDVGLLVVEARGLRADDKRVAAKFNPKLPLVVAINKSDLVRDTAKLLPLVDKLGSWREIAAVVPISALTGAGCAALKGELGAQLPAAERLYAAAELSDRTDAFFVADFIREQIYLHLEEEVPYATAVEVRQMEKERGTTRIIADILVDRPSRKAMVIGSRGAMIRRIGTAARQLIEEHLAGRVFLDLRVKVRRNWASEPAALARLGVEGGLV